MIALDTHAGGLGDIIVLAWIAEGANRAGMDVRFTRGPSPSNLPHVSDRILTMFGQPLTDERGPELHHANGGFTTWSKTVLHDRRDRTLLWQDRIAELIGQPFSVKPARPPVTLPPDEGEFAAKVKECAGGKKLAIVFPFAAYAVRNWPLQKYHRLIADMLRGGWAVMALHSTMVADLGGLPRGCMWRAGDSIERVAAMCKAADLVIGNASGGTILSGTIGTPTIAILGPDDPVTSYGYAPEVRCITADRDGVPCAGCRYGPEYSYACDMGCDALASIPWGRVLKETQLERDRHTPACSR